MLLPLLRVIVNIFLGIRNERSLIYMDESLVSSLRIHEHRPRITKDFKRKPAQKLQPYKFEFLCKEVAYLEHLTIYERVKSNPNKVECTLNFLPKKPERLQIFPGITGLIQSIHFHLCENVQTTMVITSNAYSFHTRL